MNWHDDPILAKERYHAGVRGKLLRSTLIWGPPFLLVFGALLFFGFDRAFMGGDHGGTWFLVIVLGILSLLFGFQAIGSLRDYLSKPVTAEGRVTRRWARSDSFVIKTHYIRLGKQILRGDQLVLDGIKEGDYIEASYYPKSAVLVWVEKKEAPKQESEAATPAE